MDIAEKVLQLKKDFDDVYKAGQESGGGGDYEQGYEDGYEAKEAEGGYERYASHFKIKSFNLFGKKEVVLNLDNATTLDGLISITQGYNTGLQNTVVEHLTINCPNQVQVFQMMLNYDNLNRDYALKRLTFNVDTQKGTHFSYFIRNTMALEVIDGTPLDFSSVTANLSPFLSLSALKEVRFKENTIKVNLDIHYSPDLSAETRQSIVDGFADMTGQTTITLTVHKTVYEKMVADGQDALLTAKNITLVQA